MTNTPHHVAIIAAALYLAITCYALPTIVPAQSRVPQRGPRDGSPASSTDVDSVNLTNGNLMISIPLASLPKGRGDSPDFPISLNYNSKLWDARREERFDGHPDENGSTRYFAELLVPSERGGWSVGIGYRLIVRHRGGLEPAVPCDGSYEMGKNAYSIRTSMLFPDGTERELRPLGFSDRYRDGYFNVTPNGTVMHWTYSTVGEGSGSCELVQRQEVTSGMTYFTTDGSYLRIIVHHDSNDRTAGRDNRWTMSSPDGTTTENKPADDPSASQRITDRNGNRVRLRNGPFEGVNSTIIEDDLGRSTVYQSTLLGDKVIRKGFKGERLETTIEWKAVHVSRVYNAADVLSLNAPAHVRSFTLSQAMSVVSRITFPSQAGGRAYRFSYNASDESPAQGIETRGWGELSSMSLPSGAAVIYDYQGDSIVGHPRSWDVVRAGVASRSLRHLEEHDGESHRVEERTTYSFGSDSSRFTLADGGVGESRFGDLEKGGCDAGLSLSTRNPDGSFVENLWTQGCFNRHIRAEFRTGPSASGEPSFTAVTEFLRDRNGNLLESREYDWIAYSSVPRSGGRVSGLPSGLRMLRRTVNTYHSATPLGDGTYMIPDVKLRSLIKSSQVERPDGAVIARTEYEYDNIDETGNLSEVRQWSSAKGPLSAASGTGARLNDANSAVVRSEYDAHGNMVRRTDAMGFVTEFVFGDVEGSTGLYPTRKTEAAGTSVEKTEEFTVDFETGLVIRSVAVGNTESENIEIHSDYDAAGRLTKEVSAVGTDAEKLKRVEHHDDRRLRITRSDRVRSGDGLDVTVEHLDQTGRVRLFRTLDAPSAQNVFDETHGIKVQHRRKVADGMTVELTSAPYKTATPILSADKSMGWRLKRTLSSGRVVETERIPGSSIPVQWSDGSRGEVLIRSERDGDKHMTTDESGARTVSKKDPLGRITEVWEVSDSGDSQVVFAGAVLKAFRTLYQYSPTDQLTQVVQGGQIRTFKYDSLSRLVSSTNPETGTMTYTHDDNGNVKTRRDARGVESLYFYDGLNRIVNRSYTLKADIEGYTPRSSVTYSYDDYRVPFSKGRLTRVHTAATDQRILGLDPFGRISATEQLTDGQSFRSSFRYDLTGNLTEERYPSGRVVRTDFDEEGEVSLVAVADSGGSAARTYASGFTHDSSGSMTGVRFGNGLWERSDLNSRMQLDSVTVGTSRGASNILHISNQYPERNAGDLVAQSITVGGEAITSQKFTYDGMHRIIQATESTGGSETWRQTFKYDRFGNRSMNEPATTTIPRNCRIGKLAVVCMKDRKRMNPAVSQLTNRFVADQDGDGLEDYRYDGSGNLLRDAFGTVTGYDAENRQSVVRDAAGNILAEYFYDGFGRRVKKVLYVNNIADESVVYVYGFDGRIAAEYSSRPERHLQGKTLFVTADHLGTPRMFTDQSGRVHSRHDYTPFGEEIARRDSGSDRVSRKFTGFERDSETGLDHAGARYYSSIHGRFSTADPSEKSMVALNPQSWNRYPYVLNNPLRFRDPSGELWVLNTGGDRVRNPYRWVDSCSSGQTCWDAVALGTSHGVRVYGSRGAGDITNYFANPSGQVNADFMLSHHDSNVFSAAMTQRIPEPYLSVRAVTALFNVGILYRGRFPSDGKLVFTNGNGPDGKPCVRPNGTPCHSGHRGDDIDMRYMDGQGRALTGPGASASADAARTRYIVEMFSCFGLVESYSGNSRRFGTVPASPGTERGHRDHLHVGVFDSPASGISPRRKKR